LIRYSQLRLSGLRITGKLLNAKRQMRTEKGGSLPAMTETRRRAHRSNSWTLILVCSFRDYKFLLNANAYAIKDLLGAHGRELRKPEFHRSGMGRIVRIQTMRWIRRKTVSRSRYLLSLFESTNQRHDGRTTDSCFSISQIAKYQLLQLAIVAF